MNKESLFIFTSAVYSALIAAILGIVVAVTISSQYRLQHLAGSGLGGIYILAYLLLAVGATILLSYILSYFLLMWYAKRKNEKGERIEHPRKDFVVGLVPSWILAFGLTYVFVLISNWLTRG